MHKTIQAYAEALSDAGLLLSEKINNREITGITYNSREVEPGNLFVCKGRTFRKEYLEDAIRRGAIAYVSENEYELAHE